MTTRRIIDLLPAELRSEDLKKFFAATVDHLFQPGRADHLAGFIGYRPAGVDVSNDFYLSEPTVSREAHQLEPTMVCMSGTAIQRVLFYDDVANDLRSSGAVTANESRLFEGNYYSWAPPVDIDKLNNFSSYYWFSNERNALSGEYIEQPVLKLYAPTIRYTAEPGSKTYALPAVIAAYADYDETPVALVDSIPVTFTRSGQNLVLTDQPDTGAEVSIFRYGDLRTMIEGEVTFDPRPLLETALQTRVLALTNGMRIMLIDGVYREPGFDLYPFDTDFWDDELVTFIVNGVGVEITFTPYSDEEMEAIYVVISRNALNGNPWSKHNRWVHRSAIEWSYIDYSELQAARSILEFDHRLEVFSYGHHRVEAVDCALVGTALLTTGWDVVGFDEDYFDDLQEITALQIDGAPVGTVVVDNNHFLAVGDRLLIAQTVEGDSDISPISQRVCVVHSALDDNGIPIYVLIPEDLAEPGDITEVGTSTLEYVYQNDQWIRAQSFIPKTAPLFALYDSDGVSLSDPDIYPISRFAGSRIFGYAVGTGTSDTLIGHPLQRDARGQIKFENDLHTRTYTFGTSQTEITGYLYYCLKGSPDIYTNDWHLSSSSSSQTYDDDFEVYSIPKNLQANPDNEEVTFITRSEWFDHFSGLATNQEDFEGVPYSTNNWRDIPHDLSLGEKILQHRSPLLRTMLLSSDPDFDLLLAGRYVEQEYLRFRTRFVQKIVEFYLSGEFSSLSIDGLTIEALKAIRGGKTSDFPFSLSDIGGANYFIPPTPTAMGLRPSVVPAITTDDTLGGIRVLRGHDGSNQFLFGETVNVEYSISDDPIVRLSGEPLGDVVVTIDGTPTTDFQQIGSMVRIDEALDDGAMITVRVNDIRDACMLSLETLIYSNLDSTFRSEAKPNFAIEDFVESRFYAVTPLRANYSIEEFNAVLLPFFLSWAQNNQLNYQINGAYDGTDPFTWNYTGTIDRHGRTVAMGNWRGIYQWIFDTDRPHLSPWEMLGFAARPSWWVARYGAAPYTNANTAMWDDIRDGNIAEGPRQGINARYTRPLLYSILPVTNDGSLLDPIAAGIITQAPTTQAATAEWKFGDISPIEYLWRQSPSYAFALSLASYLMKPARFVESGWTTEDIRIVHGEQWVNRSTKTRLSNADLIVHGETVANVRQNLPGIQQWVVEHMISKGQSPAILGDAVRGLTVRLAHKMAGFTTTDSLRVSADNFGIVPTEDAQLFLYASPSQREEFYSGVIVEWMGDAWRVLGYNAIDSAFNTIPGDPYGPKINIKLDNSSTQVVILPWKPNIYYKVGSLIDYQGSTYEADRGHTSAPLFEQDFWTARPGLSASTSAGVVKYLTDLGETVRVPYGTKFYTIQEVADFIFGYERYLMSRGWVFEDIGADAQAIGWTQSMRDFLEWTSIDWAAGNFIALSPGCENLKFVASHGTVHNVETSTRGGYGIVNRAGMPIDRKDTFVSRQGGEVTISTRGGDLCGLRLNIGEIEHALVLSNETIFGDIIYKPIHDVRQPRLRMVGQFAPSWNGRLDAPGYVISEGKIIPNFEKAAEDIRTAFDIEDVDNTVLRDHARHVVGYEKRNYLDNVLLSDTQQFEFYQGMIHQKGAPDVFNKLLRSRVVGEDRKLKFLEEWAFKVGSYGATDVLRRIAFGFNYSDYKRNPQAIRFKDGISTPEVITLAVSDYIELPTTLANDIFLERPNYKAVPGDLPTAGFVRLGEVNHTLFHIADLPSLYAQGLGVETRVWVYEDNNFSWNVYRSFHLSADLVANTITKIVPSEEENDDGLTRAIIHLARPHGLTSVDIGKFIVINGSTRSEADLEGVNTIEAFGTDWIEVTAAIESAYHWVAEDEFSGADDPENAPQVFIMRSMVFEKASLITAATQTWLQVPQVDEYVYYLSGGRWVSDRYTGLAWVVSRVEPLKVDNNCIFNGLIYNTGSKITDLNLYSEPLSKDHLLVFDPVIGNISGQAERELTYKLEYDPARYNNGADTDEELWGAEEIGQLWWDISAVRFLVAETDTLIDIPNRIIRNEAELNHRIQNWGKIAPGTSVDVYEWTRSLVPPSVWIGEGTLYRGGESWVSKQEFDTSLQKLITAYYFWVKGHRSIPQGAYDRQLPAATVARLIENPTAQGVPWIAAVARDCMIVSGVESYLDDTTSTVQIDISNAPVEGVAHTEWTLLRPGDDRSLPSDELWSRLIDSVVGMNEAFQAVPDTTLHPTARQGISIRPRQSLFSRPDVAPRATVLAARESLVGIINRILARKVYAYDTTPLDFNDTWGTPLTIENETTYYLSWSADSSIEVIMPAQEEYDYVVTSIKERNNLLLTGALKAATRVIRILVNRMHEPVPNWTVYNYNPANPVMIGLSDLGILALATTPALSGNAPIFEIATTHDFTVSNILAFPTLGATYGQKVLFERPEGYWQIWRYDPLHTQSVKQGPLTGFVLLRSQLYITSDFVRRTDWFRDGYSVLSPPAVTYATEQAMRNAEKADPVNTFVRITRGDHSNAVDRWVWLAYLNGVWTEVAREKGTFEFTEDFYSTTRIAYGRRVISYTNRDGSHDLRRIMTAIRDDRNLFSALEVNEIFFSMVNFAHAHCDQVNWAFKTSFMHITGYNEILDQVPVATVDTTESLLDYIDEVKPYRVKTRDFSRSLSPPLGNAVVHATDFDKPIYRDLINNVFRPLDPQAAPDVAILSSQLPWSEWYTEQNSNKIRRLTTRLIFDRIDGANVANSLTGTISALPHTTLNRPEHALNAALIGAAQRINLHYEPVGDMAEKSIRSLMDMEFKGTIVDGDSIADRQALDTSVDGNGTIVVSMNPDVEGRAAYGIVDPYHVADRPQELTVVRHHDGVVFNIKSNGQPGSPKQTVKVFDVSELNIVSGLLVAPVHEISQTSEAIAVFCDGLRMSPTFYTVDHFKRTVNLPVNHESGEAIKRVAVHIFGIGSLNKILEERFFVYETGQPQIFPLENNGTVEVVVNGVRVNETVVSNSAVVVSDLSDGDQVMLIVRENVESGISQSIRVHTTLIPYSGSRTFNVARMTAAMNSVTNVSNATIIEVDGLRLVPITDYVANSVGTLVLGNHVPLSAVSKVTATTFRNHSTMGINTQVFTGNSTGDYSIAAPVSSPYLWVTVNGKRVIQGADFRLEEDEIKFSPGHDTADVIIATSFTGAPAEIASRMMAASILPGKDILRPIKDGDYDTGEWDTEEWDAGEGFKTAVVPTLTTNAVNTIASPYAGLTRRLHTMDGGWEYIKVLESHTATLASDLSTTANAVVVNKKAQSQDIFNVPIFRMPQPDAPGVIWISGERIEYSKLIEDEDTITLSYITRGTKGTKIGDEQRAVSSFAGDGTETEFFFPNAVNKAFTASLIEVVSDVEVAIPQYEGVHYTVEFVSGGAEITMIVPPPAGRYVTFVQTVTEHIHKANTAVYGASVRFDPRNAAL